MRIEYQIKEDLTQKICNGNNEDYLQSECRVLSTQSIVHHNQELFRVQNQNCYYVQNVAT
jgi:hypothetical protein